MGRNLSLRNMCPSSMFRVEVAESHPCVVSVLTFSQGFVHIWKWILESSVVCLWALSRVSSPRWREP